MDESTHLVILNAITANHPDPLHLLDLLDLCNKYKVHLETTNNSDDKFYKELTNYTNKLQIKIINNKLHPITESNIKEIVKGCSIKNTKINLKYLNIIKTFCMQHYEIDAKIRLITHSSILNQLLCFLNMSNFDLQWIALECFYYIIFTKHSIIKTVENGIISTLINLLSSNHSQMQLHSAVCLANICSEKIEYRNLLLNENILYHLIPLIDNISTTSFTLFIGAAELLSNICRYSVLPNNKYLNQILNGLKIIIFYDYDSMSVNNACFAYSFLLKDANINIEKLLNNYNNALIIKKYQKKSMNEDKIFKNIMIKWCNECKLGIPVCIVGEIRQFYDHKIEENMHCDLIERFIILLDIKYCINTKINSLWCLCNLLCLNANYILNHKMYKHLLNKIQKLLYDDNRDIVYISCSIILNINSNYNTFKDVIDANIINTFIHILNNKNIDIMIIEQIFEATVRGLRFGNTVDVIPKLIDKHDDFISVFFDSLHKITANKIMHSRTGFWEGTIEAIRNIIHNIDDWNTKQFINDQIDKLQSNCVHFRQYLRQYLGN